MERRRVSVEVKGKSHRAYSHVIRSYGINSCDICAKTIPSSSFETRVINEIAEKG
jgi:hypothetical protein